MQVVNLTFSPWIGAQRLKMGIEYLGAVAEGAANVEKTVSPANLFLDLSSVHQCGAIGDAGAFKSPWYVFHDFLDSL